MSEASQGRWMFAERRSPCANRYETSPNLLKFAARADVTSCRPDGRDHRSSCVGIAGVHCCRLQVLHDGRRVGTLLTQRYGVNMRNVFDTQVCVFMHFRCSIAIDGCVQ
jgi:hypothetical protein